MGIRIGAISSTTPMGRVHIAHVEYESAQIGTQLTLLAVPERW